MKVTGFGDGCSDTDTGVVLPLLIAFKSDALLSANASAKYRPSSVRDDEYTLSLMSSRVDLSIGTGNDRSICTKSSTRIRTRQIPSALH